MADTAADCHCHASGEATPIRTDDSSRRFRVTGSFCSRWAHATVDDDDDGGSCGGDDDGGDESGGRGDDDGGCERDVAAVYRTRPCERARPNSGCDVCRDDQTDERRCAIDR